MATLHIIPKIQTSNCTIKQIMTLSSMINYFIKWQRKKNFQSLIKNYLHLSVSYLINNLTKIKKFFIFPIMN